MRHTKGPWLVDGEGIVMRDMRETKQRTRIGIIKNKHDAALIAAAPELLEALQELKNAIETGIIDSTLDNKVCRELLIDDLQVLIKKAGA